VSLLDKNDHQLKSALGARGTLFQLKVRRSVEMPDVLLTARQWLVIPGYKVTVAIDGNEPISIGHSDVKEALTHYLRSVGRRVVDDTTTPQLDEVGDPSTAVVLYKNDGCTLACALQWSRFFHEWSFLHVNDLDKERVSDYLPIGTCVEGIRINSDTPGFSGKTIVALSNACGIGAPKTNVARSGFEQTPELQTILRSIYTGYCRHAELEIKNLSSIRGHSLTWASQEAQFLLSPLWNISYTDAGPLSRETFEMCLQEVPFLLIEESNGRNAVSVKYLKEKERFWTIACPLIGTAERLIRETTSNASLRSIVDALKVPMELPVEPILCLSTLANSNWSESFAFSNREAIQFIVSQADRRLDVAWSNIMDPPIWLSIPKNWRETFKELVSISFNYRPHERDSGSNYMQVCQGKIDVQGLRDEIGIRYRNETFLLPGNSIHGSPATTRSICLHASKNLDRLAFV